MIDNPTRIELRNQQGPYAEARKPHGRTIEIGPGVAHRLMCTKPTDEKTEQELATGYIGYGRFGVEILLRWSYYLGNIDDLPNL